MNEDGVGDAADECDPELKEVLVPVSTGQAMVGVGGVGIGDGAVFLMTASGVVEIISVIFEITLLVDSSWFCFTSSDCVLPSAASSTTGIAVMGSSACEHTIVIFYTSFSVALPSSCLSPFTLCLVFPPFCFGVFSGGMLCRMNICCTPLENK